MAQNKIVISPDTTTVTVSSVGLNGQTGPAGPSGSSDSDFPYTGSAIISGSLEVIGNTTHTGSIYLTNGTAEDSYYPVYDANLYHQAFYKDPSAFTINNSFHTDFTGSASTTSPLVGMLTWTDIDTTGSFTLGDPYGFYNRLRIQQDTKLTNAWGIANQVLFPNEANTGTNEFNHLYSARNLTWLLNSNPTTGSRLYAYYNDVKVANPNSTIGDIWNTFLTTNLDSGTASNDVVDLYFFSDIEPSYNIEGNYYHIYADEITPPTVGGTAYNIYMPSAMDSVLGGGLRIGGDTQLTGSLTLSGSNYLVPGIVNADSGDTIVLTGSAYDSTPMIKVTHQRSTNGDITMTLPDATLSNSTNRTIRFISDSTVDNQHRAIISPSGSQTLDGGSGFTMDRSYEGIMVWSDGVEWFKIQAKNV
jgi:hypothetical protein